MRIIYLIVIRVVLLSISIAETDRPIGSFDQYHHYRQRLPRPMILEPVMKLKSEQGPLDWFINMVSKVIERPKKVPPPIIGPINLPRMAGQVYIRQLADYSPEGSNHIVIKVVTRDPVTGMNVPYDSDLSYHHSEDSSRWTPKPHSYDTKKSPGRLPNVIQQRCQTSTAKKNYNEQPYYGVRNHHYSNFDTKSFGASASNDFNRNYHFRNHQEHYDSSFIPSQSYHNAHPHRDSGILPMTSSPSAYHSISHRVPEDSSYSNNYNEQHYRNSTHESGPDNFHFAQSNSNPTIRIPYSDNALRVNAEDSSKKTNVTWINHRASSSSVPWTSTRYRQVVRNDRMVPNGRNHESFTLRDKTNFLTTSRSEAFRNRNQVPMVKFDLRDVGGLEIITPPNLNVWGEENAFGENKDYSEMSKNSGMSRDKVSIGTGDGTNLARNKSVEYTSNEQTESQTSRILQSRLSSYKVIDRSHRHQGGRNTSLESPRTYFNQLNGTEEKTNASVNNEIESTDRKVQNGRQTSNTASEAAPKVMNLTASNRWRFQEGRKPTRVVKTIYRRKPISEILKDDREITNSSFLNDSENVYRASVESITVD